MIGEKVFEIEQRAIEILGRSYKNTHLFVGKRAIIIFDYRASVHRFKIF